jgi:hypothetical protein
MVDSVLLEMNKKSILQTQMLENELMNINSVMFNDTQLKFKHW